MKLIDLVRNDNTLKVACFCHFAGDNLASWRLLDGIKVTNREKGAGTVVSILEVHSGISVRVMFDKSARDFPDSFRLQNIAPFPYDWTFALPNDLTFTDEVIFAALEQLDEITEAMLASDLAKLREQQEEKQFAEEVRLKDKAAQLEWDRAILALRESVNEVFYITPIDNLGSILRHGVLCHADANLLAIPPKSVAMEEVQARRQAKQVFGRPLHKYANFYLNPRNPMMYTLRERHSQLCVIGVDGSVLDLPRVVVSDGNAASYATKFWYSPTGLGRVNWDAVDSDWWIDYENPQSGSHNDRRRMIMSEVLVPEAVDAKYIRNIYVSGHAGQPVIQAMLSSQHSEVCVTAAPRLFFRNDR